MKRITAILLSVCMIFALAGCVKVTTTTVTRRTKANNTASDSSSQATSSDNTSTDRENTDSSKASSDSVTSSETVSRTDNADIDLTVKQAAVFNGARKEESGYALYYVDSENGDDENDGRTERSAWKTLDNVNNRTFEPGTKIMLKCGSVFDQMLVPRSSGTAGKYFIIDSYGKGAKPIINGDGEAQAVLISSLEYIEIRNLEIRNPSEYSAARKGVAVYAGGQVSSGVFHKGGVFNHIYLINLDVIDVSCTDGQRFYGGIVFYSRESENPTSFNEILVQGCTIKNTGGSGIAMASDYEHGPGVEWSAYEYTPSTNATFRNNFVSHCASDGIFISAVKGLLIESNTVTDTSYAEGAYAGIWPHYSSNVVMQYNEAYGVKLVGGDGQGYDVDIDCVNTKVQYNYSHDNEGGFILLCTDGSNGGYNKDISVRYNISQNDKSQIFTLSGPISDVKIYNNTVYTKAGLKTNLVGSYDWGTAASPKNVRFTNNIFNMNSTGWCSLIIPSRITFDTNLFYGTYGFTQLIQSGVKIGGTLTADPMFVNPGSGGIGLDTLGGYRLKSGSPAIDSGKWISQCGGRDFYGKAVTKEGLPDIGAIEY